jgi:hypothetical protein
MDNLKFINQESWKYQVTFSGDEESDAEVARKIQEIDLEEGNAIGAGKPLWEEPSLVGRTVIEVTNSSEVEEVTVVSDNTFPTTHFAFHDNATEISNLAWWYYESIDKKLYKDKPFTRTYANLGGNGYWVYTQYVPEAQGFILIEPKWVELNE